MFSASSLSVFFLLKPKKRPMMKYCLPFVVDADGRDKPILGFNRGEDEADRYKCCISALDFDASILCHIMLTYCFELGASGATNFFSSLLCQLVWSFGEEASHPCPLLLCQLALLAWSSDKEGSLKRGFSVLDNASKSRAKRLLLDKYWEGQRRNIGSGVISNLFW